MKKESEEKNFIKKGTRSKEKGIVEKIYSLYLTKSEQNYEQSEQNYEQDYEYDDLAQNALNILNKLNRLDQELDDYNAEQYNAEQYYENYKNFIEKEKIKTIEEFGKLRKGENLYGIYYKDPNGIYHEDPKKKYLDIKIQTPKAPVLGGPITAKIIFEQEKKKSGFLGLRRRTINKFVGIKPAKGEETMIKLPMYDKNGSKSKKFSIVIGVDKNGKKFISAPPDIILDGVTDINSPVKINRDGKEYTMPITYKQYEDLHNDMFSAENSNMKTNVISKRILNNDPQKIIEGLLKDREQLIKNQKDLEKAIILSMENQKDLEEKNIKLLKDNKQFIEKQKDLEKENTKLLKDNEQLIEKQKDLEKENIELLKDKEQLMEKLKKLEKENIEPKGQISVHNKNGKSMKNQSKSELSQIIAVFNENEMKILNTDSEMDKSETNKLLLGLGNYSKTSDNKYQVDKNSGHKNRK